MLTLLLAGVPATTVGVGVWWFKTQAANWNPALQPPPQAPLPPLAPVPENHQIPRITNINTFQNTVVTTVARDLKRQLNTNYYTTELTAKYGANFKYPAWNFNYEQAGNRYQQIGSEKVDGPVVVFNERTEYQNAAGQTQRVKFSDPGFILEEIKHGRLKKHPAAAGLYEQNVLDTTRAVNKFYSIPAGVSGLTALGLYVPAGEVATLKFTPTTLEKMKAQRITNFQVVINSSYWENKKAVGDSGQISNRYPFIKTEFTVNLDDLIAHKGEFQFGSPFGGTVSINVRTKVKAPTASSFYPSYGSFDFNVTGAVEMLSYVHTVTTEADWQAQVDRVLSGEISAPGLAIDFAFGSANIAATAPQVFAYKPVAEIVYPATVMKKWTAFLFLSEYFASRERKDNVTKLDFEFNNDIWGGAAAWGGGNALYSELNWAKIAFLTGSDNWTIGNNWGLFHEINHNFEQNGALFRKFSHGKTNQVSMANLSLLSDTGRWRNLYNIASDFTKRDWTRLQNMYSTIQFIIDGKYPANREYELQNILLYALGTFNFLDYTRYDVATNPDTGGFSEIVELSDYFHLNFWPALANFSPLWNDGWPSAYDQATSAQQREIDRLGKTYPAFDFVANLFAVGAYLYNPDRDRYEYTNDMQAPMDIAAALPYVFDFERGINAVNRDFSWDELGFEPTTKLGGTLRLDPLNAKRLIYTPPKDSVGQIDEFNVAINPGQFRGKPSHYVSQYIWKIKVRLVANLPVVSLYQDPLAQNNNASFVDEFAYMKDEQNVRFVTTSNPRLGLLADQDNLDKIQRARVSFNFVAPQDGTYKFQVKAPSWMFIVDRRAPDAILWHATTPPNDWTTIDPLTLQLKAGTLVPLDVYLTTKWDQTRLAMRALVDDAQSYDVFDHALVPWADQLSATPAQFLRPEYAYQPRTVDLNDFQTSLFALNVSRSQSMISKTDETNQSNYTFVAKQPLDAKIDAKLAHPDGNWFEHWGTQGQPFEMAFDVEFRQPQKVGTIIFHHRNNNHWQARPTAMRIKDQTGTILFEGTYGAQFSDRLNPVSVLRLEKAYDVSKLSFEFINQKYYSIIFDALEFSPDQFYATNKIFSIQDPALRFYGDWELVPNDLGLNISDVNAASLVTRRARNYLEFNLFAEAFDIVGQKNVDSAQFDLFVNDEWITTVDPRSKIRLDNQILVSYNALTRGGQMLRIKLVSREDKPLFLNYFQTYGPRVYTEKPKRNF